MKKRFMKVGLVVAAAAMMMTGCGSAKEEKAETAAASAETTEVGDTKQDAAMETRSEEELTDEASITLGSYDNLVLTVQKSEVTEDQVELELQNVLWQFPVEVTGRPAELGDVTNIDYVGTKDGVAFEGGTAAGYNLELGSGSFIDGFEDGVVGMNVGDEKDLNLTFPEEYHSAELAGQEVVFHVTLNAIKSPSESEIDDSLAKRALGDETATIDTLKEKIRFDLEAQAESLYFSEAGGELLTQIVDNSEITCDPDAIDQMFEQLQMMYTVYAAQYGMQLEEFLSLFLQTDEEGLRTSAEEAVKLEMVWKAVLEAEKLEATEEQKQQMAKINFYGNTEELIGAVGEEGAERLFQMGAAYWYLIDNAKAE